MLNESKISRTMHAPALTLQGRFEHYAEEKPSNIAIKVGRSALTYRQTNIRANRVAHWLQERGAGPEVKVAIWIDHSEDLIVALLAVFKAGATCVPVDPRHTPEQVRHIISDSGAVLVITQFALSPQWQDVAVDVFCIDEDWARVDRMPGTNLPHDNLDAHVAYVTYGFEPNQRPSRVEITHGRLAGYLKWGADFYAVEEYEHGGFTDLQLSSDASLTALLLPLWAGKDVHLPRPGDRLNALEFFRDDQVFGIVKVTPALVDLVTTEMHPGEVRTIVRNSVIGGATLSTAQIEAWLRYFPATRISHEQSMGDTVEGCGVDVEYAVRMGS